MKTQRTCSNCGVPAKEDAKYCQPCIDGLNEIETNNGGHHMLDYMHNEDNFSFTET